MQFLHDDIVAVDVFTENKKTRSFVGKLEKKDGGYIFTYDNGYLHEKTAISLGPDIPLTRRFHSSTKLFESFLDRIPSKQNPAYEEYCLEVGIDKDEKNEFVLLSTIGKRSASSFVFEPVFDTNLNSEILVNYRTKLGLTVRDFAILFDISPSSLSKIEQGHSSGRDTLKRIEIYVNFPEVALYEMRKNRAKIHSERYKKVEEMLVLISSCENI